MRSTTSTSRASARPRYGLKRGSLAAVDDRAIVAARGQVLLLRVVRLAAEPERVGVRRRVGELFEDLAEDDDRARVVLRAVEQLAVRQPLLHRVALALRLLDRRLDAGHVAPDGVDLALRRARRRRPATQPRAACEPQTDGDHDEARSLGVAPTLTYFPPPTESPQAPTRRPLASRRDEAGRRPTARRRAAHLLMPLDRRTLLERRRHAALLERRRHERERLALDGGEGVADFTSNL